MNDKQLETAFSQALANWNGNNTQHVSTGDSLLYRFVRYFFWAGATFGCGAVAEIYDRVHVRHGIDSQQRETPR